MSNHSGAGAAAAGAASGSNEPTGVFNLGNTCYMNAVLQALAHAPDLCMAVDVEPHRNSCPTHLGNMKRREEKAKAKKTTEIKKGKDSDASASAEIKGGQSSSEAAGMDTAALSSSSVSAGNSKIKGATGSGGGKRAKKGRSVSPTPPSSMVDPDHDEDDEYCALCEVEKHMSRVHPSTQLVAATRTGYAGVGTDDGSAVAPSTFVNGFIGHVAPWFKLGKQEDSHEFLRLLIDAMQKSCATSGDAAKTKSENDVDQAVASKEDFDNEEEKDSEDGAKEYPFRLFRGIVESNVQCGSCGVTSCKMDPIEDVGLEVVSNGGQLADIDASFKRFIQSEDLDSYKCDKCEKVGKATKTSKLASIPPILTLHLKRFRYGGGAFGGDASSRRGGRSTDAPHGSSGSAKIEGHVSFKPVMMIKSYCTTEFVKASKLTGICRLFAVIVHAGKNSHSGHYIAYVKSTGKGDEWWKVDDAKVTKVSLAEVMSAEAYMLFYRVIKHPISEELSKEKEEKDAKRKADLEAKGLLPVPADGNKEGQATAKIDPVSASSEAKSALGKRKLKEPEPGTGVEWAQVKTSLNVEDNQSIKVADELVSENIQLKANYFKLLSDAAKDESPPGPIGVSGELRTASLQDRMSSTLLNIFLTLIAHIFWAIYFVAACL